MLIIFDLPDNYGLSDSQFQALIEATPIYTLGSEYRWYRGAHFDNLVVDIPDQSTSEEPPQ